MAVTLLAVRYRPTGAEVVLDDDGTERTFWKKGFKKADKLASLTEWTRECVVAERAAEKVESDEVEAEKTDFNAQDFFTWLYKNRSNRRLRALLQPALVEYRMRNL